MTEQANTGNHPLPPSLVHFQPKAPQPRRRPTALRAGTLAAALGLLGLGQLSCSGNRVHSADQELEQVWLGAQAGSGHASPAPTSGSSQAQSPRRKLPDGHPGGWTLEMVLERIKAANPNLAIAETHIQEARAAVSEAKASYLPTLTLSETYFSTNNPGQAFGLLLNQHRLSLGPGFDATPGVTENWRTEVRAQWALFAPGRREGRRGAREARRSATAMRRFVERRLLNAGVQAFEGLIAAQDLARVLQESVNVVKERLRIAEERRDQGTALEVDVLRLKTRLAKARQEAQSAFLAAKKAEAALNHLMGLRADSPLVLASRDIGALETLPSTLDEAIRRARAERGDLQAASHRVLMRDWEKKGKKAARLPSLVAFGAYDIDTRDLDLDAYFDSYEAGVALSWKLDPGVGPRIRQAQARLRRERERLRALLLDAAKEVRMAWDQLEVARSQLALATEGAKTAIEAWRLVSSAYDNGNATLTDLLEAVNARKTARTRKSAAQAAVRIAKLRLIGAMGGVK